MTQRTRLRADAQRNRDSLLAAARAAFAEHGLEASLDEIAKRAGVGSGTLYRHFPTREDLVAAVFLERVTEIVALLDRARQCEDPWSGLAEFLRQTCQALAADRGLAEVLALGHPRHDLGVLRDRAYEGMTALIERARAGGSVRADLCADDIVLLLLAVVGITRRAGTAAPAAAGRFVALALDGFRSEAASPAPPPVPVFPEFGEHPPEPAVKGRSGR